MTKICRMIAALATLAATGGAHAGGPVPIYSAQCAKCHGENGRADTPTAKALKVLPLAGDTRIARAPVAQLVRMVKENRKHASFLSALTEADIEAAARKAQELAGGQ